MHRKFLRLEWDHMKDLCRFLTCCCLVSKLVLEDGSRGANWYCHCEVFTREHVCEGVLATRLLLKEVTLPLTAAAFKGRKIRGPGAPRDITKQQRYAHVESEESGDDDGEASEGAGEEGDEEPEGAGEADGQADGPGPLFEEGVGRDARDADG